MEISEETAKELEQTLKNLLEVMNEAYSKLNSMEERNEEYITAVLSAKEQEMDIPDDVGKPLLPPMIDIAFYHAAVEEMREMAKAYLESKQQQQRRVLLEKMMKIQERYDEAISQNL